MAIVTLTEALLKSLSATDSRIYRDRILCGFCLKANKRSRTFLVATSVQGKQFRMTLGRWPLIDVENARAMAMEILRECRAGHVPAKAKQGKLPSLADALTGYCDDKRLKRSTWVRYDSVIRTHFSPWIDQPVSALTGTVFSEHCHLFAQSNRAAIVELGRGFIGAMIRYVNAVYGLQLENPFHKLAAAGLMPERSKPRARILREDDLAKWREGVDKTGEIPRDYLLLLIFTGLRRNECCNLLRENIDFGIGIVSIPDTKNGKPHSLPITPLMDEILQRRCRGLSAEESLFNGMSKEHVHSMAMRRGAPNFILHDLRKLVATIGEKLQVGNALMRRILNHTPPKSDVLHTHYVELSTGDIQQAMVDIQNELERLMQTADSAVQPIALLPSSC